MTMTDSNRIRTTISVDRDVHQVFVAMAEAGGMSVSRCMGEWLADTAEGAQFVATKMIEARKAPMVVMREMQAMSHGLVEEVQGQIEAIRKGAASAATPPSASRGGEQRSTRPGPRAGSAPSSLTGLKVQDRNTRGGGRK